MYIKVYNINTKWTTIIMVLLLGKYTTIQPSKGNIYTIIVVYIASFIWIYTAFYREDIHLYRTMHRPIYRDIFSLFIYP